SGVVGLPAGPDRAASDRKERALPSSLSLTGPIRPGTGQIHGPFPVGAECVPTASRRSPHRRLAAFFVRTPAACGVAVESATGESWRQERIRLRAKNTAGTTEEAEDTEEESIRGMICSHPFRGFPSIPWFLPFGFLLSAVGLRPCR